MARKGTAKGGRKVAKKEFALDVKARKVVQWFRANHPALKATEISTRTGLPYAFVWQWARRDTPNIVYRGKRKRGPAPIIGDEELPGLKKKVLKVRFGSTEKARLGYINPKTRRPVHATTVCIAACKLSQTHV